MDQLAEIMTARGIGPREAIGDALALAGLMLALGAALTWF